MKKIIVSKKAKELLRKTIDEKWKLVRAKKITDRGRYNCHLCQGFRKGDCAGCPIFMKTGHKFCKKTPYAKWAKHQRRVHPKLYFNKIYCATCKKIATQEINFLEALYEECEVETK